MSGCQQPLIFYFSLKQHFKMKTIQKVYLILFVICTAFLSHAQDSQLTLNDIWLSGKFLPQRIDEIRSMNDGEHYTILKQNSIIQYKYKNGREVKTLLNGKDLVYANEKLTIDEYAFSTDESKVLLTVNTEQIYRHSYKADYFVYYLKTKQLLPVSTNGKQQLAEFSPDGKFVAFVRDNNLFVVDTEDAKNEQQITFDGEINKIINGAPDWVYEEEFSFSKGFFWSNDSRKIAYYRFDESEVGEFTIPFYQGNSYPEWLTYKYPKAGEDNSVVEIYVYHFENRQSIKVDIGEEVDQYIPRIQWTNDKNVLAIQRLNRLQNELEIVLADAQTGKSTVIYHEKNKYYIDITDNLIFLENGHFIFTSEKDGYNHIYLHDASGQQLVQITQGDWDVMNVVSIDKNNKIIYYTSSQDGVMNTMLYSVRFDGTNQYLLFNQAGAYHADFSKTHDYFILTYSNANQPHQYSIYETKKMKKLVELESNNELIVQMREYGFVKKEFFTLPNKDDIKLNAWMMKPPQIEQGKEYPVLMYVYGGPGSQTVKNSWGFFDFIWHQLLVQKGIIVVSVDNRGTGGRGEAFKKETYLQLGKLESEDQIEAAKYLGSLDYIDKGRIGIFGWSYGGYLSAICMTKGADVFSAGISVAPVTNWRYYDNIYTERFMRTPQENPDGYDKNSPMFYAKKLKSPFLLVHGDADDNVHVQNTMEFAEALVNANKQFDMFIYPNKNHGIYGGYTRFHLYNKMTNFLLLNFSIH
jgi:dipeptidyl-peptidase-4